MSHLTLCIFLLVHMLFFHYQKCNSDCKDGDIRLVGGSSILEGTVELCLDNLWGLVADSGWNLIDAQVACSQLGFSQDGKRYET